MVSKKRIILKMRMREQINSTKKTNKQFKYYNLMLISFISIFFIACQPKTIEQQVEILMKTEKPEKRNAIAIALADSLNLHAIELIKGFYTNNYYAEQALREMFFRYSQIIEGMVTINNINHIEKSIECIGQIPTNEAAAYLGKQSMIMDSTKGIIAFNQIKSMPDNLKYIALFAGLKCENENENMQDILLTEFYAFGQEAFSLVLNNKLPKDYTLYDYENTNIISVNALKKVIKTILQDKNLSKEIKMKSIICGLKTVEDDETFQDYLLKSAKQYGNEIMIKLINEWYYNQSSENILNAIISFGNNAINYLSNQLGNAGDYYAKDLLAHIGKPAVASLMYKMNNANDQNIRFAAADALVKMSRYNPSAVSSLTNAFDNQSIGIIAKNYPFYIRMGLSGTEALLLKALRNYFSTNMCLDYLNCGNRSIEYGAQDIAADYGYEVYSQQGSHYGPRWGSGN